ncbi:hypothetical protein DBZ94_06505 [Salmonella enterica subsp. enterica serovar Heidelberg]|nr:hypothetical protein DBZ94_06505 [Salmonella enterica subsp. enterica serovar Heidelberg]
MLNFCSCQTARCFNKSKGVLITGLKLKAFRNPQPSWGFSIDKKPGSDYALPGLRCRYVPVSRPGKHRATGQQDSAQQLESNHPDNRADRTEDSFHHRPGF